MEGDGDGLKMGWIEDGKRCYDIMGRPIPCKPKPDIKPIDTRDTRKEFDWEKYR